MPVTLAGTPNCQCCLVTADAMDSADVLSGNLRYFAGPLGSSSGGYLQLTEYASLAAAQASAFSMPVDGRVDFPSVVQCRYTRLYHRSTDASAHVIYEFMPRRMIQTDDLEAESIRAINIAAGAITADKIFVLELAAITATMGALHMNGVIDIVVGGGIYQGTGTFASPTTGLKLFNSGGVGKLSTYNATVEQVTMDTDGKLKAGAGAVVLDASGVAVANVLTLDASGAQIEVTAAYADLRAYQLVNSGGTLIGSFGGTYTSGAHGATIKVPSVTGDVSSFNVDMHAPSGKSVDWRIDMTNATNTMLFNAIIDTIAGRQVFIFDGGGLDVGNAGAVVPDGAIRMSSYLEQPESAQPATPAANTMRQWVTDDGAGNTGVFWIDSTGTPVGITSATAAGATAGAAGAPPAQVAGYLIAFIAGARRKIPFYDI